MKTHFERLLAHMRWADGRILDRLHGAKRNEEALRTFGHVLAAERVWLARLRGEESSNIPLWDMPTLEACRAAVEEVGDGWESYLTGLPESCGGAVTYRRGDGQEFTNRLQDVLTHVFMHGSYHRGQIARAMRAEGEESVNTDFITFVREVR